MASLFYVVNAVATRMPTKSTWVPSFISGLPGAAKKLCNSFKALALGTHTCKAASFYVSSETRKDSPRVAISVPASSPEPHGHSVVQKKEQQFGISQFTHLQSPVKKQNKNKTK